MLDNIDKNTLMEAGFPHFFIYIFPVLFQDFLWPEVRFYKTIIQSESEDCQMLYDYLSLLEKYSILISYLVRYNSAEIEADFADTSYDSLNSLNCLTKTPNCFIMKTSNCFIMKTPNYVDHCLQSCFLAKVTILLVPWKLLQRLFYCFSCSLIG